MVEVEEEEAYSRNGMWRRGTARVGGWVATVRITSFFFAAVVHEARKKNPAGYGSISPRGDITDGLMHGSSESAGAGAPEDAGG